MDTNLMQRYMRILFSSVVVAASTFARAEVTAKDAWVRGTVPAQKVTAGYVTLTSTEDVKVVGVTSPIAKKAEIHASMMMGGVNHMHSVDAIPLPAGKPVELKPGAQHVMLMELNRHLVTGETVPIVFTVEGKDGKRTQVEVKAQVRPIGGR
ncbi:MAG TPA: copper chaperone PCu(A)C [Usitatibacter sp.]|nr:copper chaperone PCu(A)C [Usitatibacter sp.]